jgi:hypothetical protein
MVVCVEADLGYFFRINTRGHRLGSVSLKKVGLHEFLDHDSYLECGGPLELDDYVIDESLRGRGIRGRVSATLIPDILKAMEANKEIALKTKRLLGRFYLPSWPSTLNYPEAAPPVRRSRDRRNGLSR